MTERERVEQRDRGMREKEREREKGGEETEKGGEAGIKRNRRVGDDARERISLRFLLYPTSTKIPPTPPLLPTPAKSNRTTYCIAFAGATGC